MNERDWPWTHIMSWVLFALLAFLVFGIPLIDEVYRYRARRGRVK